MLTKFWESLGGQLADKWISYFSAPALGFWAGGLFAWIWRFGLSDLEQRLNSLNAILIGILVIASLIIVVASSALVHRLELPLLRLLEGYWPRWLNFLRTHLISRHRSRLGKMEKAWQALANVDIHVLDPIQRQNFVQLDQELRLIPPDPTDIMPTRIGNCIRAAEIWPQQKYGLDAVVCWPRLWLLLPDNTREDLSDVRATLDRDVRLFAWSMLFVIWTVLAWWAFFVAIVATMLAYRLIIHSAEQYSNLVESTFDVHRFILYEALRFSLPTSSEEEKSLGAQLTEYLWRGGTGKNLKFLP